MLKMYRRYFVSDLGAAVSSQLQRRVNVCLLLRLGRTRSKGGPAVAKGILVLCLFDISNNDQTVSSF